MLRTTRLCKLCGVTYNTTNLKRHLRTTHPENHTKIQKTSNDGPSQASDSAQPRQTIFTAFLGASKYKIDSKEQHAKEEAIAR
ncbi:hypothetical protein AB205_0086370 [Aquarana catesbeiana]|uniref:BED-type domain-containing protein n=1 Tax=Aquarana catesbeiana TaxID=8400 RepID=A0A2G9R6G5_AQUCT|nr:hypothetical protein AB205_0086370 [Aquarana catesbeiana]